MISLPSATVSAAVRTPAAMPGFSDCPTSWYYLGSRAELRRGPLRYELPGERRFVGYLTRAGAPVVLGARCVHMGADLSRGCVHEDRIVCPLHGWEFGPEGACRHMPAAADEPTPSFARQPVFPVAERGGHIFFFNAARPRFELPFFAGTAPDALRSARPFDFHDDVPWYYIAANGFDVQHFRSAHDRTLVGQPEVDVPDPFARRIRLRFKVSGNSLADRVTRVFAGPEVVLTLTAWGGTLIFVTAEFKRTTSYGLMTVRPLPDLRTHARVIVWVRRSGGAIARACFDPLNTWVRRGFIHRFLSSDIGRMSGMRHDPNRLIQVDRCFAEYMEWIKAVHR